MKSFPIAVTAAALLSSCATDPTEVVVTVDTTFGVPCTIDTIVIEATRSSGETQSEMVIVGDDDLPGSLTIVDDSDGQLRVSVRAFRGEMQVASGQQLVEHSTETSKEVQFLLDQSCTAGPCPATHMGEFHGMPARAPRLQCGQEAYDVTDSLITPRNACITDTLGRVLIGGADEQEAESPLDPPVPFPFFYYGEPIEDIWVGDNGYLSFGKDAPDALTGDIGDPRSLGNPGSYPGAGILPFWDKMTTGSSGICFSVLGTEPNRILWITWERACFQGFGTCGDAPEGGSLTFSVGLEETTNKIIVGYQAMTAAAPNDDRAKGQSATVGITSGRPPACEAEECGADGLCDDGTACGYTEASSATIRDTTQTIEFRPATPE